MYTTTENKIMFVLNIEDYKAMINIPLHYMKVMKYAWYSEKGSSSSIINSKVTGLELELANHYRKECTF